MLASVFSGNVVTGASGQISGRKSVDGGAQGLLSGFITETAGGQYVANLYDWDISGRVIGYLFTASGCAPVSYTVPTDLNVSGRISLISGQLVNVYSGQLSGQVIDLLSGRSFVASGINVTVPTATLSGVVAASGLSVIVPIASVSGINAVVPPETLSGVVPASGVFANVPIASISGVFGTASLNSGQIVNVYSGQLSGHVVDLLSGRSFTASGINASVPQSSLSGVVPASGGFVVVSSGFPTSGYPTNFDRLLIGSSGQVWANSGTVIALTVNDKSGYTLAPTGMALVSGDFGDVRQMLNIGTAILVGKVSGANTGTEQFWSIGSGDALRAQVTVDSSGNRTAVLLSGG